MVCFVTELSRDRAHLVFCKSKTDGLENHEVLTARENSFKKLNPGGLTCEQQMLMVIWIFIHYKPLSQVPIYTVGKQFETSKFKITEKIK